jgi:hypothetical protein
MEEIRRNLWSPIGKNERRRPCGLPIDLRPAQKIFDKVLVYDHQAQTAILATRGLVDVIDRLKPMAMHMEFRCEMPRSLQAVMNAASDEHNLEQRSSMILAHVTTRSI